MEGHGGQPSSQPGSRPGLNLGQRRSHLHTVCDVSVRAPELFHGEVTGHPVARALSGRGGGSGRDEGRSPWDEVWKQPSSLSSVKSPVEPWCPRLSFRCGPLPAFGGKVGAVPECSGQSCPVRGCLLTEMSSRCQMRRLQEKCFLTMVLREGQVSSIPCVPAPFGPGSPIGNFLELGSASS